MKKNNIATFILRLVQGTVIGVGAVLPGISGGVLATVFGIYEPLMEVLAHPIKKIKEHIWLIVPVLLGIAVGFLGLAKLVRMLYVSNEKLAICIFIGLILGTLPSLWRTASEKGHSTSSMITMAVAFAVMLAFLFYLQFGTGLSIEPNMFWFCLCGALLALGMIVPGMCAPSILLFLGLYEPLLSLVTGAVEHLFGFIKGSEPFKEATTGMRIPSCLMFALGLLGVIALLAKPVNYLLKKIPSHMYHAIFGIVCATLIPLIPLKYSSVTDFLVCLGGAVGGFVFAFALDLLSGKLIENRAAEEKE